MFVFCLFCFFLFRSKKRKRGTSITVILFLEETQCYKKNSRPSSKSKNRIKVGKKTAGIACQYRQNVDVLFVIAGEEGAAESDLGGAAERRLGDFEQLQVVDRVRIAGRRVGVLEVRVAVLFHDANNDPVKKKTSLFLIRLRLFFVKWKRSKASRIPLSKNP